MPIYCYQCEACGNTFEAWARIDERMETRCPSCTAKCKMLITCFNSKVFNEYVEENIGDKPIVIKSTRHLKDELKKREEETRGMEKLIAY